MMVFLWDLFLQPLLLITWMDENNFEDKDACFAQRENRIFLAISCQEFWYLHHAIYPLLGQKKRDEISIMLPSHICFHSFTSMFFYFLFSNHLSPEQTHFCQKQHSLRLSSASLWWPLMPCIFSKSKFIWWQHSGTKWTCIPPPLKKKHLIHIFVIYICCQRSVHLTVMCC